MNTTVPIDERFFNHFFTKTDDMTKTLPLNYIWYTIHTSDLYHSLTNTQKQQLSKTRLYFYVMDLYGIQRRNTSQSLGHLIVNGIIDNFNFIPVAIPIEEEFFNHFFTKTDDMTKTLPLNYIWNTIRTSDLYHSLTYMQKRDLTRTRLYFYVMDLYGITYIPAIHKPPTIKGILVN